MDVEYTVLAGDPDIVRDKGREYEALAAAIRDSVRTLDDIVSQVEQKSLAMEATRGMASDVASDIRKATERYEKTGEALVLYAEELRRAKDDSTTAVLAMGSIEGELVSARSTLVSRQEEYETARAGGDPDEIANARRRRNNTRDEVSTLEGGLEVQRRAWEQARDAKVIAAAAAVSAINDVVEGDGGKELNDSNWDKFSVVLDVVKFICDIAAILSIFLAWVPILGQVLVVLAAIGAILAIIDAGIKWANGEGGFGDFLGALVLGVLALFGGKIIGVLAKRLNARAITQLPAGVKPPPASLRSKIVTDLLPGQTKGPLAFLKSPFVRSTSDSYRYLERVTGSKFGPLLLDALKQSNPFNLRTALKYDGEVANLHKLVDGLTLFVDQNTLRGIYSLVALESVHALYKNYQAVDGLADVLKEGEMWEIPVEFGQEIVGRLDGPVPKTIDRVTDAVRSGIDVHGNGN